jgi:hypothetical protein
MVLDRTEPDFVVQRMTTYLRQCKTGRPFQHQRVSLYPDRRHYLGRMDGGDALCGEAGYCPA